MNTAITTTSRQRRRKRSIRGHAISRRRWRAWVALLAVVVAAAVLAIAANRDPSAGTATGAAPPFTLPSTDGRIVSLDDFAGRDVLLYFNEGVGCDICFDQLAQIERAKVFDGDLTIVPIVVNDVDATRGQLERFRISTPYLADPTKEIAAAYDTLGRGHHADLPGHSFVLVDSGGQIAWRGDYPTMWVEPAELAAEVEAAR